MNRSDIEARLLDYVVGEVEDTERAAIAAALAQDPVLRDEERALRECVAVIAASGDGAQESLTPDRRATLMAAAEPAPRVRPRRFHRSPFVLAALAAGLLAVIGVSVFDASPRPRKRLFQSVEGPLDSGQPGNPAVQVNTTFDLSKGIATADRPPQDAIGRLEVVEKRLREHGADVSDPGGSGLNTEEYSDFADNPFVRAGEEPLSTFSIDVDTASYANTRRFLHEGRLPPPDAVRIEELLNYFKYDYDAPTGGRPFAVHLEVHKAPWHASHRLVRIGLRGQDIHPAARPIANLVFLIDVSGSMNAPEKLPLVQKSLQMLTEQLDKRDRVAIVVYAGSSGLVLDSTECSEKDAILSAIQRLQAGGSTNGGAGIHLAYRTAEQHFVKDGVNRVILCTDGDFNVGVSSQGDLVRLIEDKRRSGVFLSVLGFGKGNYSDARMQALADKGNGNASYIDSLPEARKVLVEEASGTLITIAKDVKIQVEFNPAKVAGYRLIGYENRMLAARDFNDDKKDAGEIGAGHQVTALYEVVLAGEELPGPKIDPLKYQKESATPAAGNASNELFTIKLRWKKPDGEVSEKLELPMVDPGVDVEEPSADFHFASAVAAFGMLLRNSEHKGQATFALAYELAQAGVEDRRIREVSGTKERIARLLAQEEAQRRYRAEFLDLVKLAKSLAGDR